MTGTTRYIYNFETFDTLTEASEHIRQELNEKYPPYQIGELTFYAGDILAKMDPIAFHGDYVSPFVEEQYWDLIADDVNGFDYQIKMAEVIMEHEFPAEYAEYVELCKEENNFLIDRADEIERLTDHGIKWVDGHVWMVSS